MEINSKNLLKNHSVNISGRDKIEVLGATVGENATITVNKKISEDVDGGITV